MLDTAASFHWTEANVALLRARHEAGVSAGRIADELGQGCTRNAVIGKIHRLGLTRDVATIVSRPPGRPRNDGVVKAPAPAKPKPTMPAPARVATPTPKIVVMDPQPARRADATAPGVTILELRRRHCRWPVSGAGIATAFCGELTVAREVNGPECPYCDAHARMAYAPRRSDEQKRADESRRQAMLRGRKAA